MSDEESYKEWLDMSISKWITKSEAKNPEFIKWVKKYGGKCTPDLWWDIFITVKEIGSDLEWEKWFKENSDQYNPPEMAKAYEMYRYPAFLNEQIDDAVRLLKQEGPGVIAFIEKTNPGNVAPEKDACANGGGVIWAFKRIFGRLGLTYDNIRRKHNGIYGALISTRPYYLEKPRWYYRWIEDLGWYPKKTSIEEIYELAITILSELITEVYEDRGYIDGGTVEVMKELDYLDAGKSLHKHVEEKLRSTLYLKSLITLLASKVKKLVDKATRRALEYSRNLKREREEQRQERRLKRKVDLRFH